jgi:hypothetical protein
MLARLVVVDVGVLVPFVVMAAVPGGSSTSEESGVVGRDVWVLNDGRSRDVRDGDGGRGVGGRL